MLHHTQQTIRHRERGSALLMAVFFAAVMLITAGAAMQSVLTEGRRQQEEDLIWRGNQYARAVKLFYRKNGRFPTSLEELTKPQNNVRFLRRAYPDPMNTEDGSWRLIYVAPNGQLIGSVSRANALIGLPQAAGGPGRPAVPAAGSGAPAQGTGGAATGTPQPASTQSGPTIGTPGSGPLIGGNIIGVGSKVPKLAIMVYNGSQVYREWEFIWDPTRDAIQSGQPGAGAPQPGTPAGQPPGGGPRRP